MIFSVDGGKPTGSIELQMPFKSNDYGFSKERWEEYINEPRNRGLRVGMVENYSTTDPYSHPTPYKGIQERLTNSAIELAK